MRKTKYFKPYKKTPTGARACTLQKTGPGVYVIREGKRVVYVGYSSTDVKKTLYRHFQKWVDKRHPESRKYSLIQRVTYYRKGQELPPDINCRVIFTTKARAALLEAALIKSIEPRDNSQKLDLYRAYEYRAALDEMNEAEEEPPF